jgi:hypothetical protein
MDLKLPGKDAFVICASRNSARCGYTRALSRSIWH